MSNHGLTTESLFQLDNQIISSVEIVQELDRSNQRVIINISDGEQHVVKIELHIPDDLEDIGSLFDCSNMWIEKITVGGLQYGNFVLGVSGDSYSEIRFDQADFIYPEKA